MTHVRRGEARSFRSESIFERVAGFLRSQRFPTPGWLIRVYQWLLGLGPTMEAVLPGGERVRIAPEHRQITWNPVEYEAFRVAVRPGDIVLDVGANVGCYTVLFARWAGAAGHVFAFEPDPRAFRGLETHVQLNEAGPVVTTLPRAIGERSAASMPFRLSSAPGTGSLLDERSGSRGGTAVEVVSIDDFCAARGIAPAVIKIDVEGLELAVLRGARRTIAAAGPGLRLFVEMHPSLWERMGITEADIHDELRAQGLLASPLDGAGGDPLRVEGICVRLRRAAS